MLNELKKWQHFMVKWIVGVSFIVCFIFAIFATIRGADFAYWAYAFALFLAINWFFVKREYDQVVITITIIGWTAFLFYRAVISRTAPNIELMLVMFIGMALFLDMKKLTGLFGITLIFIIITTSLGVFTWFPEKDPDTGLFYATSMSLTLPILIMSYLLALIIRKLLLSTIEKLAESQTITKLTNENIKHGIVTTNTEGIIQLINRRASEMVGVDIESAKGRRFSQVFKIYRSRKLKEQVLLNSISCKKMGYNLKQPMKHHMLISKENETFLIFLHCTPIQTGKSNLKGYVILLEEAQERLNIHEEHLRQEKYESMSLFTSGIAHDYNNILSALQGNLELIKMEFGVGEKISKKAIEDHISDIQNGLKSAKELTSNLMMYAKISEKKLPHQYISLDQLIENVSKFISHGSKINCNIIKETKVWPVKGEKSELKQAFQNLILNAIQSNPTDNLVHIRIQNLGKDSILNNQGKGAKGKGEFINQLPPRNYLQTQIIDQGSGIKKQNLNKIFDPYFTTKKEGTGLGLAITYNIITSHDGFINVDSDFGQGTTFSVFLPAFPKIKIEKIKREQKNKISSIKGKNILVLEDNKQLQRVIQNISEKTDMTLVIESKGVNAVKTFRKHMKKNPFNLVIADLTIKGGGGAMEILPQLKKIQEDVKCIIMSGYPESKHIKNYKRYGFVDRLIKPFNIEEWIDVIHRNLN